MIAVIFEAKHDETGCECNSYCKVWKQGHSFKCKDKMGKRVATRIRYWQPRKSIIDEFLNNCATCHHSTNDRLKKMKETLGVSVAIEKTQTLSTKPHTPTNRGEGCGSK